MKKAILGISAYYHDSAAAILVDGQIVAAAQEERFTRKKHDSSFPLNACQYVLQEAGIDYKDLTAVSFYDKPFLKFERLLETYHAFAPSGFLSFLSAIPAWIKEKLFMRRLLGEHLAKLGDGIVPVFYPEHHLSHAASAFYPSPFSEAAILTVDGVGEWATTTIGRGRGKEIEILKELQFPHSVGLLYSAFTYYTGFAVNSGEYKLMGLAPYGDPDSQRTADFKNKITTELVDIRKDGSIVLNMDHFEYATGLKMANEEKWEKLFGVPRRKPESEISQVYMDMALAIQQVTEEIVLRLACTARQLTGSKYLVLAGASHSTVLPTGSSSGLGLSTIYGFSRPPAMRVARLGPPMPFGTFTRETSGRPTVTWMPWTVPISGRNFQIRRFVSHYRNMTPRRATMTISRCWLSMSQQSWRTATLSAGCRAAWNSDRERWETEASWETRETQRCRRN